MLRLRPYRKSDAKTIVKWLDNECMFRKWSANLFKSYPITADELNNFYDEFQNKKDFWVMTAFDEAGISGQLFMFFVDEEKSKVRFGLVIVDKNKRGKGYGSEMIRLAAKYAFEILKVEKISLGVFENNEKAHKCYSGVGFKDTGESKFYEILNEKWKGIEMELVKGDLK